MNYQDDNEYDSSMFPITYSKWKKRFAFLPQKCHASGKIIWLKFGYKINSYVFSRLSSTYWRDTDVHLIELLKGNPLPRRPIRRPPPSQCPPPPGQI